MAAALMAGTLVGTVGGTHLVWAEEKTTEAETSEKEAEEKDTSEEETDTGASEMKIAALKGPTAMGMAQLLDDDSYEFSIVAAPDEIVPMIVQGQVDVAAIRRILQLFYIRKRTKISVCWR